MNLVSYTENAMLRSFNSQERLVVNVLVSRNSSSWLSFSKEFVGTSFRHLADRSGRAQIRNLPTKGSLMMGGSHSKDEMPSYSIQVYILNLKNCKLNHLLASYRKINSLL